jgi:hypothetical protein
MTFAAMVYPNSINYRRRILIASQRGCSQALTIRVNSVEVGNFRLISHLYRLQEFEDFRQLAENSRVAKSDDC